MTTSDGSEVASHGNPHDDPNGKNSPHDCDDGDSSVTCRRGDVCVVKVVGTNHPLLDDDALLHPLVRLHAVDLYTGRYLAVPANHLRPDHRHRGNRDFRSASGGATVVYRRPATSPNTEADDASPDGPTEATTGNDGGDGGGGRVPFASSGGPDDGGVESRPCGVLLPCSTPPCPLQRRLEALSWKGDEGRLVLDIPFPLFLDPRTLILVEVRLRHTILCTNSIQPFLAAI
jgi:hypothetical protein